MKKTKTDIFEPAPPGQIYVCAACGKTSKTQAPSKSDSIGWDESCMMNAVLCYDKQEPSPKPIWWAVDSDELPPSMRKDSEPASSNSVKRGETENSNKV